MANNRTLPFFVILLMGLGTAPAREGARVSAAQPANPVYEVARPWEEKFSQEGYVPASPLEKALHEYFKRLGPELGRALPGDAVDFSRISGRVRRELGPETERLIDAFTAEGYSRADTERYIQMLYDRLQREMTLYFGRANENARRTVQPVDAPTSDEQIQKAEKMFWAKDYVGALKALENALRFAPSNVRLIVETAIRQQAVGQLAEARENFDQARGLYPRLIGLYLLMGEVRAVGQDYYGAINDFNVALGLQPDAIPLYASRGNARLALGDYEGAIDDFGLQIATGFRWRLEFVYLRRSTAYYKQGNLELALADLESALRVAPQTPEAYRYRGIIQERQEKYDLALASFTRALELKPGDFSARSSRVWAYYQLNQPELALADARRAADENVDAGMNLAVLLEVLDQFHQAETQYRRLIELAQSQRNNRLWCYANFQLDIMLRRLGRSERAYLEDVLNWPDEWPKRIGLYLAGRIDSASLLKAAQQEPNLERRRNQVCEANYYLGMTLWTDAKKAEAIPYLETAALADYSGNYEYTQAKKILRMATGRSGEDRPADATR